MWLSDLQERTVGATLPQTVPCVNSSGMEIPAFSVVRTNGIVTDRTNANYQRHQCYRPNAASMANGLIIFSGPAAIASGASFQGHVLEMGRHAALIAKYTGTAPAVGDNVGTATDTFTLKKDNTGFVVTGVNTTEELCYVRPFERGGWSAFPSSSGFMTHTKTGPFPGTPYYTSYHALGGQLAVSVPFVVSKTYQVEARIAFDSISGNNSFAVTAKLLLESEESTVVATAQDIVVFGFFPSGSPTLTSPLILSTKFYYHPVVFSVNSAGVATKYRFEVTPVNATSGISVNNIRIDSNVFSNPAAQYIAL